MSSMAGQVVWLLLVPMILAVEIAFFVGISVPVANVLTRLRANYLPHAVSLDHVMEAGREPSRPSLWGLLFAWRHYENPKIGPNIRTFIPMARRVYRLEGIRGLYKGTTLVLVQFLVMLVLILLLNQPSAYHPNEVRMIAVERPFRSLCTLIVSVLVLLPTEVLLRRTMVHHAAVSWRHPRTALRQVLSPAEVLQPWRLYIVPGLVPLQLFRHLTASYMTHMVRYWTLPLLEDFVPQVSRQNKDTFEGPTSDTFRITFWGLLLFVGWSLSVAVLLVPIDCILVRLMTQYDRTTSIDASTAPASHNHQASYEQDVEDEMRATTTAEPVTSLRPCYGHDQPTSTEFGASEVQPYTGAWDCACKMYDEEGEESLMRGAFYTVVGYMLMAFT